MAEDRVDFRFRCEEDRVLVSGTVAGGFTLTNLEGIRVGGPEDLP